MRTSPWCWGRIFGEIWSGPEMSFLPPRPDWLIFANSNSYCKITIKGERELLNQAQTTRIHTGSASIFPCPLGVWWRRCVCLSLHCNGWAGGSSSSSSGGRLCSCDGLHCCRDWFHWSNLYFLWSLVWGSKGTIQNKYIVKAVFTRGRTGPVPNRTGFCLHGTIMELFRNSFQRIQKLANLVTSTEGFILGTKFLMPCRVESSSIFWEKSGRRSKMLAEDSACRVDLPIESTSQNFSFDYEDDSHSGCWIVSH